LDEFSFFHFPKYETALCVFEREREREREREWMTCKESQYQFDSICPRLFVSSLDHSSVPLICSDDDLICAFLFRWQLSITAFHLPPAHSETKCTHSNWF